jgi:2-methylcitrate dehydratase PrpD
MVADPSQTMGRSKVTIRLADGTSKSVQTDAARGAPGNPATLDDLRAKYARCVEGRLSQADSAELLDLLVRLDQVEDLRRFFQLLGSAHERIH